MIVSANILKWGMRLYPPLFFQRIWVKKIHPDFMGADITIYKSLLNINANKSIFGGTIFSAIDPFYPVLLDQYFQHNGIKRTVAWLKTAQIDYIKPARHQLRIQVRLDQSILTEALTHIQYEGKITRTFNTRIFDSQDTLCAVAHNEIYIRDLIFDLKTRPLSKGNRAIKRTRELGTDLQPRQNVKVL